MKLFIGPVGIIGLLMNVYLTEVADFHSNSAKHRMANSVWFLKTKRPKGIWKYGVVVISPNQLKMTTNNIFSYTWELTVKLIEGRMVQPIHLILDNEPHTEIPTQIEAMWSGSRQQHRVHWETGDPPWYPRREERVSVCAFVVILCWKGWMCARTETSVEWKGHWVKRRALCFQEHHTCVHHLEGSCTCCTTGRKHGNIHIHSGKGWPSRCSPGSIHK